MLADMRSWAAKCAASTWVAFQGAHSFAELPQVSRVESKTCPDHVTALETQKSLEIAGESCNTTC